MFEVILETCEYDLTNEREQYYIDKLITKGKDYNLNYRAGSWKGFKHKLTTIEKIRQAALGPKLS